MAEPVFTIEQIEDYHPTELGFDNGNNLDDYYGESLYSVKYGELVPFTFKGDPLAEEFFGPKSSRSFVLSKRSKEQGLEKELSELNGNENEEIVTSRRGAETAYFKREREKKPRMGNCRRGYVRRRYKKITRTLGRYL